MARRWPALGVGLAILWLFVRGVEPSLDGLVGGTVTGLLVGMPVAYLLRGFYTPRVNLAGGLRSVPHAFVFTVLFLKDLLLANFDVAYRVLAPSMPIDPDVVEVPLRIESDLAITTIANSITLTPGTLTMDYDSETNTLYVHAISGEDHEAVVEPIRNWEDELLQIFHEDRDPSDPVPPRPSVRSTTSKPEGGDEDGD